MAEATYLQDGCIVPYTVTAAVTAGQVIQLPDGRAGVAVDSYAAATLGHFKVGGYHEVAKTATMVMLPGSRLFWDASANAAHLLHGGDADFYLGVCVDDAASADTTVRVNLNAQPAYNLSLASGYESIPVSTAGWPHVYGGGNGWSGKFDLTAEAQKIDALSHRKIATGTKGVLSALICVNVAGDAASADFNVGLADDTHATDADTITSSLFCHIDGGSTNIAFESDNAAAEVTATDSTVDFVARTPFLVQWDLRDWSDIQVYVNGVNVLPASVFTLAGVAGPLKLLCHMEKDANDTPGNLSVLDMGFVSFDAGTVS